MNEEEILQNMDYVSEQLVGAAEAIKADTDERRFDEADDLMKAMFYLDREIDRVRKVEAPGGYSEVALWLGQHFALRNGYLDLLFPTIIEQEEDKIKGMIECRKAVAKRYAELTRR